MSKNPEVDCEALLRSASKSCPMPRAAVREAVRRECTSGLCSKKAVTRRSRLVACAGLFAFLVGGSAFLASGVLGIGYAWTALWGALGWAVVLLAILAVNLRPQVVPPMIWRAITLVGLPGGFFLYLIESGHGQAPFSVFIADSGMCVHAVKCGVMSSLIGAVAAAGFFYVWRGSDPFSPRVSGVALGLMGGIAGALVAGFVCPGQNAWHVVLGHGLSLVVLALGGAAIGRRVLSP
jgi:Negative regulator of sigma F